MQPSTSPSLRPRRTSALFVLSFVAALGPPGSVAADNTRQAQPQAKQAVAQAEKRPANGGSVSALPEAPLELQGTGIAPLLPAQQAVLDAAPQDLSPEARARDDVHFYVGNENELNVFYPDIRDRGGAYVGVGSDQAYLFLGWQRPQVAFLIDYDAAVVAVHRIHQLFFSKAANADEFLTLWSPASRDASKALIEESFAGDPNLKLLVRTHKQAHKRVHERLSRIRRMYGKRPEIPTYLTDPATYTYVRAFVMSKRARPMLVNLLDKNGLIGVGNAARALGVPVRVMYFSNAEEYWQYSDQFRANIYGLPYDDKSLVIRTLSTSLTTYEYVIQPFDMFVTWLKRPVRHVRNIARRAIERQEGVKVAIADTPPPVLKRRPKPSSRGASAPTP